MATYFKNTELAAQYNISEATVRNWIKSTKEGRHPLELIEYGGHTYVAKSVSNIPIIERLVGQNRKYRNTLASKTITPSPELFEVFNEAQVYDIVRNLELHHEIPRQYGYFGSGAKEWDEYVTKQAAADLPSMLCATLDLLAENYEYLSKRLAKFKKINIIDIGAGNALPVKGLLMHLIAQDKLGRYVAIDFSDDMLNIAKESIQDWFGDQVRFEGYQLDMAHERFAYILGEDYLRSESVNLVLLLGATPSNLRVKEDAFRTICESMGGEDLFICTNDLKPASALPEWFKHSYANKPQRPELLPRHKFVLDLLNIKDSMFTAELGTDGIQTYSRIRLKHALTLNFIFDEGQKALQFEKGDTVTLWRCWQTTPRSLADLLESTGFCLLHSSISEDRNYILTIAEIQRD